MLWQWQFKVRSRFWLLVLPEKSEASFPGVNPAYGDMRSHFLPQPHNSVNHLTKLLGA
jgi:hypothetical protein